VNRDCSILRRDEAVLQCTPITEVLTRTEQTDRTYQPGSAPQSEYIGGESVMPNRDVCAANAGTEAGFQTSINDNVALQDKGLISHSGAVRRQAGSSRAVASLDSGCRVADAGRRSRSAGLVRRPTEIVFSGDLDIAEAMKPAPPPGRLHTECVGDVTCIDTANTAISALGVSGVGNQNTIRTQLFREHESAPMRTTQDSTMFMPILAQSSRISATAVFT